MEQFTVPAKEDVSEQRTLEPFVNEECGDTMWDEVLKEAEAKMESKELSVAFSL